MARGVEVALSARFLLLAAHNLPVGGLGRIRVEKQRRELRADHHTVAVGLIGDHRTFIAVIGLRGARLGRSAATLRRSQRGARRGPRVCSARRRALLLRLRLCGGRWCFTADTFGSGRVHAGRAHGKQLRVGARGLSGRALGRVARWRTSVIVGGPLEMGGRAPRIAPRPSPPLVPGRDMMPADVPGRGAAAGGAAARAYVVSGRGRAGGGARV